MLVSLQPLLVGAQEQIERLLETIQEYAPSAETLQRARELPDRAVTAAQRARERLPFELPQTPLPLARRRRRTSKPLLAAIGLGALAAGFAAGLLIGQRLARRQDAMEGEAAGRGAGAWEDEPSQQL